MGMVSLEMNQILNSFEHCEIGVIGDLILDRYTWGDSRRISPEAPVPVVDVNRHSTKLGGAGNAAQTMSVLGADVTLFSRIGDDPAGNTLRKKIQEQGLTFSTLPNHSDRPTTVKTRVIAEGQHLVRIDEEDRATITCEELLANEVSLRQQYQSFDAILISDYGKGVFSEETLPVFLDWLRSSEIPVIVDPHTRHFTLYENVTLLTPNENEFREGVGDHGPDPAVLSELAQKAFSTISAKSLLVTRGEQGMVLFEPGEKPYSIDTEVQEVYDVTGAGDTVSGVVTMGEAVEAPRRVTMRLANIAAGLVVQRMGTTTVSVEELREEIA